MSKFVIITAAEVADMNWDDLKETSADTLRYNIDQTKTFVKYDDRKPSCLWGKDVIEESVFKDILNDPDGDWSVDTY